MVTLSNGTDRQAGALSVMGQTGMVTLSNGTDRKGHSK